MLPTLESALVATASCNQNLHATSAVSRARARENAKPVESEISTHECTARVTTPLLPRGGDGKTVNRFKGSKPGRELQ